eukprot:15433202-Alexandrium_andersonii.AAC.1
MPRVCLTQVAFGRPPGHAVQEPRLLEVSLAAAKPALDFARKVGLRAALRPIEVLAVAREREAAPRATLFAFLPGRKKQQALA